MTHVIIGGVRFELRELDTRGWCYHYDESWRRWVCKEDMAIYLAATNYGQLQVDLFCTHEDTS